VTPSMLISLDHAAWLPEVVPRFLATYSQCLRAFFFLHTTFLFKFEVQMKNSVSCRCPTSVKNSPKSSLCGSNTYYFSKKGNDFDSVQSSDIYDLPLHLTDWLVVTTPHSDFW
jgi:hypothetical protein